MGKFTSGLWIIGLLVYFFTFFLIIFSIVNAAPDYDLNTAGISVSDPGFSSAENQPFAQQGECKGRPYYFCSSAGIDNDTICNGYTGCYWDDGLFAGEGCHGVFEAPCSDFNDEGNCSLWDCTWSDFTNVGSGQVRPDTGFDWSAVKDTILIMTGFDASIGAPASIMFIVSFFMFWIPFFMLLWSIYMALPFIH